MTTLMVLNGDEVHIWRASLAQPADALARLARLLSPDERDRASRYLSDVHRSRFVASRAIQRDILSRYASVPGGDLAFTYSPTGKPELAGPAASSGLTFSVSNSGDLAVYAITRGRTVGVDIEELRPLGDAAAIAERFLSPSDVAAIEGATDAERALVFLQRWTRLEAGVKALGGTVADSLDVLTDSRHASGSDPGEMRAGVADESRDTLCFRPLDLGPTYVGQLALESGAPVSVRYVDWLTERDH